MATKALRVQIPLLVGFGLNFVANHAGRVVDQAVSESSVAYDVGLAATAFVAIAAHFLFCFGCGQYALLKGRSVWWAVCSGCLCLPIFLGWGREDGVLPPLRFHHFAPPFALPGIGVALGLALVLLGNFDGVSAELMSMAGTEAPAVPGSKEDLPPSREPEAYDGTARDLARARRRARRDDKHLLAVFGADWCPASRDLAGALADGRVHPYLDAEYEVIHVDLGTEEAPQNGRLLRRYAEGSPEHIPYAVILDPRHRVVSEGSAPSEPTELLAYLEEQRARDGIRRPAAGTRTGHRRRSRSRGPRRVEDERPQASDRPVELR